MSPKNMNLSEGYNYRNRVRPGFKLRTDFVLFYNVRLGFYRRMFSYSNVGV